MKKEISSQQIDLFPSENPLSVPFSFNFQEFHYIMPLARGGGSFVYKTQH
jgi:hypothetical protein